MNLKQRHRLRISIRTQLIALVLFVAMFSLLVLAIVTGCYFTSVLTDSRISKLEVVSELKSSQLQQYMDSYYIQILQLSEKSTLQKALTVRKAGNTSTSAFEDAELTIKQTLEATSSLVYANLYDLNFVLLANVSNPDSQGNATSTTLEELYILSQNTTSDGPSLPSGLLENRGYLQGPIMDNDRYYASVTVPVYTNESILLPEQFLSGYLSVILDLRFDNSTLSTSSNSVSSSDVYIVNYYSPIHPYNNFSDYTGFFNALDGTNYDDTDDWVNVGNSYIPESAIYNISKFGPAEKVFMEGQSDGVYHDILNPRDRRVSLGYSSVDLGIALWLVVVEQYESDFKKPTTQLIKIMVGLCIGLAVFLSVITFPLAHYGVRPILKLQKATEEITDRRGLKRKKRRKRVNPLYNSNSKSRHDDHPNSYKEKNHESKSPPYQNNTNNNTEKNMDLGNITPTYQRNLSITQVSMNTINSVRHSWNGSIQTPSSVDSFSNSDFDHSLNGNMVSTPLPSLVESKGLFYDELTELTEAFNAMTFELDQQYTHLEERVRARTKELEAAKVQADTARQQAEKANEAKTVFIANISHELRTPLNGILGMTSVAMSETDQDKIQQSLELIFRSGELLLHILIQLLTFSKNQLDKSKLHKKNFLMVEVASQIKSIFGNTAKERGVNLLIIMKPKLLRKLILNGDSNRIIQVVMNLVSNSLKFTPENGTVRVLLEIIGEYDEDRSKDSDYQQVFIKDLPYDVSHYPVKPISQVVQSLFKNPSDSGDSSSISSKKSVATIDTLRSSIYHKSLSSLYNSSNSNIEFFNNEEFTLSENNESAELNGKTHKCHKFNNNKKWVLRFSVSDTGTGIEKSLQDKIFEAFVQGDQTLSRSHGGTGLGLSICKQFAQMMHGTLTIDSTVGEGSTFTFTIPLPQVGELILTDDELKEINSDEFNENYNKLKRVKFSDDLRSESDDTKDDKSSDKKMNLASSYRSLPFEGHNFNGAASHDNYKHNENHDVNYDKPDLITRASTGTAQSYRSKKSESSSIENLSIPSDEYDSGLKLLVAEDNLVNQEVVKRMLKLEHVSNVTMARDGRDAVDFVRESMTSGKAFDLILMDVQMPNMDGLTATKIIRKFGYTGPIVALTAFADVSNEKGCIDAGMSGFLSKPIRRNLLKNVIRQFCFPLNTTIELNESSDSEHK